LSSEEKYHYFFALDICFLYFVAPAPITVTVSIQKSSPNKQRSHTYVSLPLKAGFRLGVTKIRALGIKLDKD
jgi:hypothetical protein